MAASPAPENEVWKTFTSGLGLQEGAAEGQRLTASAVGAPPLAGIVDWTGDAKYPHVLFLCLDEPTSGVASLGAHRMWYYLFIKFPVPYEACEDHASTRKENL